MKELYDGHAADAARARERFSPKPLTWFQTVTAIYVALLAAWLTATLVGLIFAGTIAAAFLR